jgi:hypothetical protein
MLESFLLWLSAWSPMLPAPTIETPAPPTAISGHDQPAPIQGSGH